MKVINNIFVILGWCKGLVPVQLHTVQLHVSIVPIVILKSSILWKSLKAANNDWNRNEAMYIQAVGTVYNKKNYQNVGEGEW